MNQPWCAEPRQRRVLVDRGDHRHHDRREEDEEAPEDERVHQPRHEALQELALAEDDRPPRCGRAPACRRCGRPACAARTSRARNSARRPNSAPVTTSSAASADRAGERRLCPAGLSQLGADGRDDLVQVADHGVVGAGEDRRLRVGVDGEDLLRALRARDVLRRAADPAGDVEVGGDLRARLADLVGVRPPPRARDDARAADRRAEQPGELLDDREALGGADAAAAADDDLRVAERDAAATTPRRARARAATRRPAR